MSSVDPTTATLTGVLPFLLVVAAVLSLPVCFGLLRLYRRAVLSGMNTPAGAAPVASPPAPLRRPPGMPLRLMRLDGRHAADAATLDAAALARARRGPWRQAAVYATAGLLFAVVMTAGWMAATHDEERLPIKLAILTLSYAWPAVIAVMLVAAYDTQRRLQLLAAYFGALAALAAVVLASSPSLRAIDVPIYWLVENLPPSVLVLAFVLRRIRAVGPMVLAFLLIAATGSQVLLSVVASDMAVLRRVAMIGFDLGLGAHAVFFLMVLTGMLAFAALGWPLLRWLGRRYEARRFSDQGIVVDALFLMFGVVQSVNLAFEGPWWVLTGLVAFAAFKGAAWLGWRLLRRPAARAPTLLLLRVFRLGRRSELLFDKLRRHWQSLGSIRMIAGPDLVTTTVEPHEFLEFLSGRLGRQFVTGGADLDRRMAGLDDRPDPDGRYRIHEFFCRADTWQMTMERLAATSDAVLMDLRSFAPANQGCLFELGRLLDGVPLARLVLLVDATTDTPFLEAMLARLWHELGAASPNRSQAAPTLRVFQLRSQSEAELGGLLAQLLSRPA